MNGYRAAKYDQEVEAAFEQATTVDIGVAFVTKSGIYFGQIQRKLNEFLARDGRLRLLLDLQLGNTDPTVLEEMLALQNSGLNVECRAYVSHADGVFHPKVYIFHKSDGTITVVTGSANWTGPAYSTNVEFGVVFEGAADTSTIKDAVQFFNEHWNSANAKVIDGEAARLYRSYWRRRQGLERKARNRAASAWRHLAQHLARAAITPGLRWPNSDTALLLGAVVARGAITSSTVTVTFKYGADVYQKGEVAYQADDVAHEVPDTLAKRLSQLVDPTVPSVRRRGKRTYELVLDFRNNPTFLEELSPFLGGGTSYRRFTIPTQIQVADDREIQEEFLRGYALACGLVSKGTYDPTRHHQVWLRPATENTRQFDQIADLLQNKLGIPVYKHRRATRDVAIKVKCEAWLEIGFGVDWLDALVEEGARENGFLAPPEVS